MTRATEIVLRNLLEGIKKLCESAIALMTEEVEPETPAPKPRFLGDTNAPEG